jgi:hypothetical protein
MFRYSPKLATSEEQIAAQEKQLVKHILWRKMQNKVKQINSTQGKDFIGF